MSSMTHNDSWTSGLGRRMTDIPQSYVLVGLASLLVLLNLGFGGLYKLVLLAILSGIAGCLAFLLALYASCRVDQSPRCARILLSRPRLGTRPVSRQADGRGQALELTGSAAVDAPLQEMLDYILRDYVYSWYSKLASSQQFPVEVRSCLARIVSILAEKMGEVDWVNYLTTHLVDDVASHLRLYKSARNRFRSPPKEGEARNLDLESLFFDAEVEMEGRVCRDLVCTEASSELRYLQDLTDLLLYLLLPQQDFQAGPVRSLVREVVACSLLQPLLHHFSNPDQLNQTLVWLLRDCEVKTDVFISTLRHSDSLGELEATKSSVIKEISRLRSRDSCADDVEECKDQLNSLLYLKKVLDTKICRLQSGFSSNSYGLPANIDWSSKISTTAKLFNLPLEVILKNNISLSYFIDYMNAIGAQYLVFFYLNIEGWKVAAEQQLQALELEVLRQAQLQEEQAAAPEVKRAGSSCRSCDRPGCRGSCQKEASCLEGIRDAALSIYQEYLSEKASPRVSLDDGLSKRLLFKIRTEPPDPDWFDEVAGEIYKLLELDDKYLVSFKRSVGYLKLLAELDLLKADLYEEDEEGSMEYPGESGSMGSFDILASKGSAGAVAATDGSSGSDSDLRPSDQCEVAVVGHNSAGLSADIVGVEMGRESSGKQYVSYLLSVAKGGSSWDVTRRYSDFHHLHTCLTSQFPVLEKIAFPGKKTFGNLERNVVEKRQKLLNGFLGQIIQRGHTSSYPGLIEQVTAFLLPGWEINRPGVMERAVSAVSQDIQRSVKTVSTAVTAVPASIAKNVDTAIDGLTRAFVNKELSVGDAVTHVKVGSSLEETDDNIPLRITLLFLDEVFDLADRNMWLRRQIITVLRQIINTMAGDIVNKKIVDYFTTLTSEEAVAGYLTSLKDSLWPEGRRAATLPRRDDQQQERCRVAARAALISSLPDELRRVIGSETSRVGLVMIFDMLQIPTLNRRLVIVLLEGIIAALFPPPNHHFQAMFERLHSRSSRTRNDLKNSQRSASDLRHRREKSK